MLAGEGGQREYGEARRRLGRRGDPHPVLRGRGPGRCNQLAGRRRAHNVPFAGAGRASRGSRRHQRSGPAPRLPGRGVAYPGRADRGASAVGVAAPYPYRAGGPGRGPAAGLDGRPQLRLHGAVAGVGGTVLFALEPRLSRRRAGARGHRGFATTLWPLAVVVVFVVALYGGCFGAGIGILMISALSLLGTGDIRRVVPLKNLLTGCLRGVAVAVLIVEGAVNWGYGLPMAVGGYLGGYGLRHGEPHRLARGLSRDRVRPGRVLLLDPVRSAGAACWRRMKPFSAHEPCHVVLKRPAHDAELPHPRFRFRAQLTVHPYVYGPHRGEEPLELFPPRDHGDVLHYALAV